MIGAELSVIAKLDGEQLIFAPFARRLDIAVKVLEF